MSAPKASDVRLAVIGEPGGHRYPMFEVSEIAADGARLDGTLLLEPGEEVAVELAFSDDSTIELRARVVAVAAGESRPGVHVVWSGLDEDKRALLEKKLTNGET